jgi:hypothetical protein
METRENKLLKTLQNLIVECGVWMAKREKCKALNGRDHVECEKMELRNADCYEKVLCERQWKIKADCLDAGGKTCLKERQASADCRRKFFQKLITPALAQFVQKERRVYRSCQETAKKIQDTIRKFGENSVQTREASTEHIFCIWSHMVNDPSVWTKFIECRNNYPTQIKEKCREEIKAVVADVEQQEDEIAKSLGITEDDYEYYGGPADIFQDLLYPVLANSRDTSLLLDPAYQEPNK